MPTPYLNFGAQKIRKNFMDPYGCNGLQMQYNKHRFATFPIELRERFENQVQPSILADAGFYYADNNMIDCYGCVASYHLTEFFHRLNKIPQCDTASQIQNWHSKLHTYCNFEKRNVPIRLHWSREDCRLVSLLDAKWRKPDLWPDINILDLAKSGLYSENQLAHGVEDKVVCFSCKIELSKWVLGDTPDGEHVKFSSDCPYLTAKMRSRKRDIEGNVPIDTVEPVVSSDIGGMSTIETVSDTDDYCVYKVCREESFRKSSFPSTWPHSSAKLSPAAMASAGFFYVDNLNENGDRVACYRCGLAAESWVQGDDPISFHTMSSPSCKFSA